MSHVSGGKEEEFGPDIVNYMPINTEVLGKVL
jgi:hypothetical protein